VISPCLKALSQAHAAGIVHGDLRPSNVFLTRQTAHGLPTSPQVMNFGFGNWFDRPQGLLRTTSSSVCQYLSPEELRSEGLDARSDVYSFGVMIYTLLTGAKAFTATNTNDLAVEIVAGACVPLSRQQPRISTNICAIVERAMATEPDERYQTLDEMLHDIGEIRPSAANIADPRAGGGPDKPYVWVKVPLETDAAREGRLISEPGSYKFPPELQTELQREMRDAFQGAGDDDAESMLDSGLTPFRRRSGRRLVYAGSLIGSGLWIALGVHLFHQQPDSLHEATEVDAATQSDALVEQSPQRRPEPSANTPNTMMVITPDEAAVNAPPATRAPDKLETPKSALAVKPPTAAVPAARRRVPPTAAVVPRAQTAPPVTPAASSGAKSAQQLEPSWRTAGNEPWRTESAPAKAKSPAPRSAAAATPAPHRPEPAKTEVLDSMHLE
jgi:Protein kinase domain